MEIYRAGAPKKKPRWRDIHLGLPLLVAALGMAFLAGLAFQRSGSLGEIRRFLERDLVDMASHRWAARESQPERISIDIKPKHFDQLSAWRDIADRQWQITSDLKEYVPATVTVGETTCKARVRLKGEWGDHVDTDKWSLRVKLRDGATLFGMKRFSIQHPKTRSYIYEWVHHETMRRAGVIALRYDFVDVTINGRGMGIYALEEHFTKQLLEFNRRRAGVIVKLNADFRYKPVWNRQGSLWYRPQTAMVSQHSAQVTVYDEDKVAEAPALSEQFTRAVDLLEGLRARKLTTSQVFDTEKLASYIALSELLGTLETAGDWSDMRFYYDPIAARLEPIAVEGAEYKSIDTLLGPTARNVLDPDDFHARLFADDAFFQKYVAALEAVSAKSYVDGLLESLEDGLQEKLGILWREWPHAGFSDRVMRENAQAIRDFLRPEQGVHAWVSAVEGGKLTLEVGALQVMPVEILRIKRGVKVYTPTSRAVLPGVRPDTPVDYRDVSFETPGEELTKQAIGALRLSYRLLGSSQQREVTPFPRPRRAALPPAGANAAPNADTFDFVAIDEEKRIIELAPGRHVLTQDLVFPPGYSVHFNAATTLDLTSSAMVVSRSPVVLRGSADAPIRIESSDGTGQGVFVLDTGELSIVEHVVFQNLHAAERPGWALTGAVTFYKADVEIRGASFEDGQAEDALNIVQSSFVLERSVFRNHPSDAFDGDFTKGQVVGCSFLDISGDGLDFSGSDVQVTGVRFHTIADKALSVGEGTTLAGRDIRVQGARFGVASKDLSRATLENITLLDVETGLAAYEKKPEYGPGRIEVRGLSTTDTTTLYRLEEGSTIVIDGKSMKPNADDLAAEIYRSE